MQERKDKGEIQNAKFKMQKRQLPVLCILNFAL
jgi:hypothetical protein